MKNFRTLPKLRDSLSFVYFEHAKIVRNKSAISVWNDNGETHVPIAALGTIMFGPGTSVTHEAIKVIADNGCSVLWVGKEGINFYAQGMGETRSASRLLKQSKIHSDQNSRMAVVLKMYKMRFNEELSDDLTIQQIRGKEGVRVRTAYSDASTKWNVKWIGRKYSRKKWDFSDPVNRALSTASSCLYGICHCAIVSAGYSPSLGFIHTGKLLSFVYDIADIYKVNVTIPVAFEIASEYLKEKMPRGIEHEVRTLCRERFREFKILDRVISDIDELFKISLTEVKTAQSYVDASDDPPGFLWDPEKNIIEGGQNYDIDHS